MMRSAEEILDLPEPNTMGAKLSRAIMLAHIRAAQREAIEAAARCARDAWMVPPDGGSPTPGETDVCDRAEAAILALLPPSPPPLLPERISDG